MSTDEVVKALRAHVWRSCRGNGRPISEHIGTQAADLIERQAKAIAAAQAKLGVVETRLDIAGLLFNEAGHQTDTGLWLEKARDDLTEPSRP